jgi:probable phosphoglycerate mutase
VGAPEVWLFRHGETEWSATGRHTGNTDVPLTEAGRQAARRLAPVAAGVGFARVLTSPLTRARDTCELAGLGGRAQVVDALREWDYGEDEGRTTKEIRAERPGWTVWRDGARGGEQAADVGHRVDAVIAELRDGAGPVALFAHGHVLRVLAARWCGLPAADGAVLALDTATVSVLGWEREQPVLRRWNALVG